MSDWKLPQEGGCLCGGVRFRVSAPPLFTSVCHCKGCQRMTGSAYSLSAAVPSAAFEVIAGDPVIGALHGEHRHFYCSHCMSWLFTRPDGADFLVNVRATMLDEPGAFAVPFMETGTRDKLPWVITPATHSFHMFPEMEDFPKLLEAFAQQTA